jgi:hypothetical protein
MAALRLRRVAVVCGAAILIGAASWAVVGAVSARQPPPAGAPTGKATVRRVDLTTTQQVNGTLGFDGSYSVLNLVGSTAAQRSQAQTQLAQAVAQETSGRRAATDARATSAAQIASDQAQLDQATAAVGADQRQLAADQDQLARDTAQQAADCATSPPTAACTADRQAVAQDNQRISTDQTALLRDQQTVTQDQGKLRVDQAQGRQQVDAAQAQADQAAALAQAIRDGGGATAPTTVTAVPQVGDTIDRGGRLYALDNRPVVLLTGDTPVVRQLAVGVPDGPDVAVLATNLAALGFSPGHVDQHFDAATAAAVRAWQGSLGEPRDGVVHLGDVFVEPTALRVTAVNVNPGGAANPGATVLTGTSTTPVVTIPLQPAKEYLVHAGDPVQVDLPDGKTTTAGHIRDISRVATNTPNPSATSSPSVQSQQQGQQNLAASAAVTVTVTLDNPGAAPLLDQAPVQVDVTDQTAKGVLAVPVDALLALAGGGYGLELVTSGGHHVVSVQVGLFGNGMVQVSGSGVTEGATVEVPAS